MFIFKDCGAVVGGWGVVQRLPLVSESFVLYLSLCVVVAVYYP